MFWFVVLTLISTIFLFYIALLFFPPGHKDEQE